MRINGARGGARAQHPPPMSVVITDACARCAGYWWGCVHAGVFTPPEYERTNGMCERDGCMDPAQPLTYMCWACRKFYCVACMHTMSAQPADPTLFESWLQDRREVLWARPSARHRFTGSGLNLTFKIKTHDADDVTVDVYDIKIARANTQWKPLLDRTMRSAASIMGATSVRLMHVQSHLLCDWCVAHDYTRIEGSDCWERQYIYR